MCAAMVRKCVFAQMIDDVQVSGICEQMFDILYIIIILLLFDIHICNNEGLAKSCWQRLAFWRRANGGIACDAAAVIVGATGRGGPMPPPPSIKKRLELQRAYTTMYTRCYCIT
jgi:hypothetical protein